MLATLANKITVQRKTSMVPVLSVYEYFSRGVGGNLDTFSLYERLLD